MFNLIVAVLSIALIGITAGASVYYGGAAFDGSNNRARASALIDAGGQIAAAQSLYMAENGGERATSTYTWDNVKQTRIVGRDGIDTLIEAGYLQARPPVLTNLDFQKPGTPVPVWTIDETGTVVYLRLSDYVDDRSTSDSSTKQLCHNIYDAGGAYVLHYGAFTWAEGPPMGKVYGRDGELVDYPKMEGVSGGWKEPRGNDLDLVIGQPAAEGFFDGNQVVFGCVAKPWDTDMNLDGRYFIHRL